MPNEIVRRGYRMLLNAREQVRGIWEGRKVKEDSIKQLWPKWMEFTAKSLKPEYPFMRRQMIQERLFEDMGMY
jgi:hypothetical protein